MELLKLLNTNELVSQIICFLLLLAILRVFLWKRFLDILDKRREKISSEFGRIEEAKELVSNIKSEYEKKIAEIDAEARLKIQEAMAEARRQGDEIRARAERDGDKLLDNAKTNIKDELAKAKEELKDSVVDLAIQVAEKVTQEKLSEAGDRRLVEDFLDRVENK